MGADSNLPVLRRGSAPVSKLEARQCRTRCEADSRKWSRSLRNCNGRERPFAGHREGRRWFVSLPRLHAYLRWRRNQIGVRLIPEKGRVRFEIVTGEKDHSPGTVKGGDGSCPFPDCTRTFDGDEIKSQALAGRMGGQLYCVVYREERIKGRLKTMLWSVF